MVYLGTVDFDTHLNGNDEDYMIVFEEINKNDVYKHNAAGFKRMFQAEEGLKIVYKRFHGWGKPIREINDITLGNYKNFDATYTADKYLISSKGDYVDKIMPNLKLKTLYDEWEGDNYFYVGIKIQYEEKIGHAICYKDHFDDGDAVGVYVDLLGEVFNYVYIRKTMDQKLIGTEADLSCAKYQGAELGAMRPKKDEINCDMNMIDILVKLLWSDDIETEDKDRWIVGTYFVLNAKKKDWKDAVEEERDIFHAWRNNQCYGLEKDYIEFNVGHVRTQEKIYNIARKLYPETYRFYVPEFVKKMKDAFYYECYIKDKKIAIEYRAKSSFVPLDLMDGEEKMHKIREAQEHLRKTSEINGVHVIYVDYDEEITEELIKRKVEENIKYC